MFLLFFPEEIQKLPENALNKNTVKTTNTWMNVWESRAESEGLIDDIRNLMQQDDWKAKNADWRKKVS